MNEAVRGEARSSDGALAARRMAAGDPSTPFAVRCASCRSAYDVTYRLTVCMFCGSDVEAVQSR
jgi:rRNA maturation endonuclease Nob1